MIRLQIIIVIETAIYYEIRLAVNETMPILDQGFQHMIWIKEN